MGITATIQSAIQSAFDAFGDYPLVCTFYDLTGGTYNTTTGIPSDTATSSVTEAFVFDFKQEERLADASIGPKDKKLVVNAVGLAIEPQNEDRLTVGGANFIIKWLKVPVPGIWIIRGQPA